MSEVGVDINIAALKIAPQHHWSCVTYQHNFSQHKHLPLSSMPGVESADGDGGENERRLIGPSDVKSSCSLTEVIKPIE